MLYSRHPVHVISTDPTTHCSITRIYTFALFSLVLFGPLSFFFLNQFSKKNRYKEEQFIPPKCFSPHMLMVRALMLWR